MRALFAFALSACAATTTSAPAGAPDWVHTGSGVRRGVAFGLGSSEGIDNPALARSAAAARARAEISRILQTYSQSLMKDYQASSSSEGEAQRVEQVIRSFSATVQRGAEITDYWVGGDRTYALAKLDFDRASFDAEDPQVARWWSARADDVWLDLEREMSQMGAAAAGASPAATALEEGWLQGDCPPGLLCGVGTGPDRASADAAARAELGRMFEARVEATQSSYEAANRRVHSATGETWVEVQRVSDRSLVSTDKLVRFSMISARQPVEGGRFAALATIDRAQAGAALRAEIAELDGEIEAAMGRAEAASVELNRFRALRRALEALAERAVLDGDLQVIAGRGVPPPVAQGRILAQLQRSAARLPFRVEVVGPSAQRVRGCLEEALTQRGYELHREDPVLEVQGRVDAREEGRVGGQAVVRTTLELSLLDLRSRDRFATVQGTEKATRPSFERSVSTAAFKLCRDQIPEMIRQIEARF